MPASSPIAIFYALQPPEVFSRFVVEASANGARVVRHLLPILQIQTETTTATMTSPTR